MFYLSVKKQDVQGVLARSLTSSFSELGRLDRSTVPESGEWLLVWEERPHVPTLPDFLLVGDERKAEVIAWFSTYMPSLRPISKYTAIVTGDDWSQVVARKAKSPSAPQVRASAGVILVEALFRSQGKLGASTVSRKINVESLEETFSYAFFQGLLRGCNDTELRTIYRTWRACELLRGGDEGAGRLVSRSASDAFRYLFGLKSEEEGDTDLFGQQSVERIVMTEIAEQGEIAKETLARIAKSLKINAEEVYGVFSGPRERRIESLQSAITAIAKSKGITGAQSDFYSGLLFSMAAPGSIEYLSLLVETFKVARGMAIWYGVFAGLHPKSEVLDYGNGVAIGAITDVMRSIYGSGKVEAISFEEYEILQTSKRVLEWRAAAGTPLYIEIVPKVVTLIDAKGTAPLTPRDTSRSRFSDEDIAELSLSLERAMGQLRDIQRRVQNKSGVDVRVSRSRRTNK